MSDFARDLRHRQTEAEKRLWQALRGGRCGGFKFRRQHSIGPYVADFCCESLRLIVELDGAVHDEPERQLRDLEREEDLRRRGFQILRFKNDVVITETTRVIEAILAEARLAGA